MEMTLTQLINQLRELKRKNPQLADAPVRLEIETDLNLERSRIAHINYHSAPARLVIRGIGE